jgi:hypothetical protein
MSWDDHEYDDIIGPEEQPRADAFEESARIGLDPWSHRDLAKTVAKTLGLPVDAPRTLADGTTVRFLNWHRKHVN